MTLTVVGGTTRGPCVHGGKDRTAAAIPAEAGRSDCLGSPYEAVERDWGRPTRHGRKYRFSIGQLKSS